MTTDHSHLFIGAILRKLNLEKIELSHQEIDVIHRQFEVRRFEMDTGSTVIKLVPRQK